MHQLRDLVLIRFLLQFYLLPPRAPARLAGRQVAAVGGGVVLAVRQIFRLPRADRQRKHPRENDG
eukprot:8646540-Pyramimonas_sp.AAC.1